MAFRTGGVTTGDFGPGLFLPNDLIRINFDNGGPWNVHFDGGITLVETAAAAPTPLAMQIESLQRASAKDDLSTQSLLLFKKVSSYAYPPACVEEVAVSFLQRGGTPPVQVKESVSVFVKNRRGY